MSGRAPLGELCVLASLALAGASCSQTVPAPLGEALMVVDTDLAVPQLAGRLRVDLYSESGVWYESRDVGRPQPADWPASFSVFSPDQDRETRVLVRLRIYPEGLLRDYLGERFADEGGAPPDGPTSKELEPRLVRDGQDVTPLSEPKPTATIDRLVLLRLRPGSRGRVSVTLRGACSGTMALLGHAAPYQSVTLSEAETCIETEHGRELLEEQVLDPDMSVPTSTALGTFARGQECDPAVNDARAACVPGGAFIFGNDAAVGFQTLVDAVPERLARMDRFFMDRTEVTVRQLRAALAQGFSPPTNIVTHEADLGTVHSGDAYELDKWCTFSTDPRSREDHPVNCVDWPQARAYCKFVGGDLPTEAQWEYASGTAGKPYRTSYPWGIESPTCDRLVYGRSAFIEGLAITCSDAPPGPAAAGSTALDVTPNGLFDMGGNVAELVRDELADFGAPCWLTAPQANPSCATGTFGVHGLRGSAFVFGAFASEVSLRNDDGTESVRSSFGFRCAFPSPPGRP